MKWVQASSQRAPNVPPQAQPGKLSEPTRTCMAVVPMRASHITNVSSVQFHLPPDLTGEAEREAVREAML